MKYWQVRGVSEELDKKVRHYAIKYDRTKPSLIRWIIKQWIAQEEDKENGQLIG